MATNSVPKPKQQRAKDTVAKLLEATDRAMRAGGEAAVRIQEISADTGISIGSIYHHFQDRDGLIRATYSHNYARVMEHDLPLVKQFMDKISSREQLMEQEPQMVEFLNRHFKNQPALERAAIVGTSAGRPLMQAEMSRVQHVLNESATEVMDIAAEHGILKDHLNPRAAAMVVLGLLLGRAVAELDSEPVSDDDWAHAALTAMGGLFIGPSLPRQ